jgi:hypothetical protein
MHCQSNLKKCLLTLQFRELHNLVTENETRKEFWELSTTNHTALIYVHRALGPDALFKVFHFFCSQHSSLANSGLPTAYTSLVALTQFSIRDFMDSLLQHSHSTMQFYTCDCLFAASFNSTGVVPHIHGSLGATNPHSCYAWLQTYAVKQMRTALFWAIMKCKCSRFHNVLALKKRDNVDFAQ